MDLNTITTVRRPGAAEEIDAWRAGDAWLAGGTWLFSEPQPGIETLIDLAGLGWTPIEVSADGITIAATCRIAEIAHFRSPDPAWRAVPLFRACCNSSWRPSRSGTPRRSAGMFACRYRPAR